MRALIVKTSSLGDIVQTYPVVEYLKSNQHVDHVGWAVEERLSPLVRSHPLVDEVIGINTSFLRKVSSPWNFLRLLVGERKKFSSDSWDVVFDLQGNCKSALYTWFASSSCKIGYGRKTAPEWPNVLATTHRINPPSGGSMRDEYLWMVKKYFNDERFFEPSNISLNLTSAQQVLFAQEMARWPIGKDVWMLVVGSRWPNKMCLSDSFKRVLSLVREKYHPYFIFVAGNGDELREVGVLAEHFCADSHVIYQPELPVLQRVMGQARAVVSVDSFLLHFAATTGVPTFGIFGPSLGKKYAPSGNRDEFFQGKCPYDIQFEKRCPFLRTCHDGACLKNVDPSRIFKRIDTWYSALK